MNKEDIKVDIKMNFQQIISLTELMLEYNKEIVPNILTLREIAQNGLSKVEKL